MALLCKTIIIVLLVCAAKSQGLKYRSDYTFNEEADGWFKFHRVPATWNDAKLRCHAEGAILVSPLTDQRKELILKQVSNEPVAEIFTGIHATFSDGVFTSIEGIPMSRLRLNWLAGEPKGIKNCLAMKTESNNGSMLYVNCDETFPYLCFKKRTELALTECGTHDTEYKLETRTGSCYKMHRRGLDWNKAFMTCIAEGAHLAVINSNLEASVVKEFLAQYRIEDIFSPHPHNTYIGVRDMRDGGWWMTVHGQTLTEAGYDKWSKGQPDNSTNRNPGGEDCVSLYRNGLFNDVWCSLKLAFLCEKKQDSLENVISD